jgi:single-strand DNA-binding protein
MNLNKVFLIGRVTADPELRTTPGGQSVTNFGLATNRIWTDKAGAKQNETEFHNIVAWGRSAEIASQYLKKGSMAFVEGRLRTRTWQDKQGQTRRTTEIMLERLQLGPRAMSTEQGTSDKGQGQKVQTGGSGKELPALAAEEIPTIDLDTLDELGVNPEQRRRVDSEGTGGVKEDELPF